MINDPNPSNIGSGPCNELRLQYSNTVITISRTCIFGEAYYLGLSEAERSELEK